MFLLVRETRTCIVRTCLLLLSRTCNGRLEHSRQNATTRQSSLLTKLDGGWMETRKRHHFLANRTGCHSSDDHRCHRSRSRHNTSDLRAVLCSLTTNMVDASAKSEVYVLTLQLDDSLHDALTALRKEFVSLKRLLDVSDLLQFPAERNYLSVAWELPTFAQAQTEMPT
jgi:hypothetical protein